MLILSLVLISIIVSAFQQHKNKLEANRKTELSKQKVIIDITEAALSAAEKHLYPKDFYYAAKNFSSYENG
jgi:hypothetical protein